MGLDAVIYTDEKEESQLATKRLGNFSRIAFIRESARRTLGARSLVVSKILYDGTHSGDVVAVSDLQPLASELQALAHTGDRDVQALARDLLELVHTALSHERHIHFALLSA